MNTIQRQPQGLVFGSVQTATTGYQQDGFTAPREAVRPPGENGTSLRHVRAVLADFLQYDQHDATG